MTSFLSLPVSLYHKNSVLRELAFTHRVPLHGVRVFETEPLQLRSH